MISSPHRYGKRLAVPIVLAALLAVCAAPQALAQIPAQSRARKFWDIFQRSDSNGKALAFDVLSPADHPLILKMAYKALGNTHPLVMASAADLLSGTTGEKALAELFEKGGSHRSWAVRYAVSLACGTLQDPRASTRLAGYLEDRHWLVRCASLRSLGRRRVTEAYDNLARAVSDKDPRVRIEAVEALRALNDLTYVDPVIKALEDPCWQVRSTAIAAARRLRARKAFEPLVRRLEIEKGRCRLEAHLALVDIAGRDLGEDPVVWLDWWEGKVRKEGLEGRVEREQSDYVIRPRKTVPRRFFNVKTDSQNIVFVLDISESMNSMSKPLREEKKGVTRVGDVTRFTVLLDELSIIIKSFDQHVRFNIILFGSTVKKWKGGLEVATPKARSDAIQFTRSKQPKGDTNLFDALAQAFGVSSKALRTGKGYFDEVAGRKGPMDFERGPDTIFLLSDGVPNRGEITDSKAIVQEITRANRVRRIVIHTIAVGSFSQGFLRSLAVENGGFARSSGR